MGEGEGGGEIIYFLCNKNFIKTQGKGQPFEEDGM
jgi:hypothetical protein